MGFTSSTSFFTQPTHSLALFARRASLLASVLPPSPDSVSKDFSKALIVSIIRDFKHLEKGFEKEEGRLGLLRAKFSPLMKVGAEYCISGGNYALWCEFFIYFKISRARRVSKWPKGTVQPSTTELIFNLLILFDQFLRFILSRRFLQDFFNDDHLFWNITAEVSVIKSGSQVIENFPKRLNLPWRRCPSKATSQS